MSAEIETLHVPFASYLDQAGIPFIRSRSDVESTIQAGHPDFTLTANNRCLMIEFKTKEGKLSSDQCTRIAALEAAGNLVLVLRDLSRAISVVEAWRGQLGEIIPAGNSATAVKEPGLVRFGASVFRRTEGRLEHVRVATPADASLPTA